MRTQGMAPSIEISANDEAMIHERRRRYTFGAKPYFEQPVTFVRGLGSMLEDTEGRQYLDFYGGIVTVGVGHCEPRVTAAVEAQLRQLQHVSTLYGTLPLVDFAERLAKLFPGGHPAKVFFTNSGTEAVEMAVLTARLHTGRSEVISLRHAYHGRSMGAMSWGGQGGWRLGGASDPSSRHAVAPNCYRCPFRLSYPSCGLACAEDVREVVQTETNGKIAAFIAEPILGVGGFITPPPGYFKRVAEIVREAGGLFIADEVQTAWGRTGNRWFGIEHHGVVPDIITGAKSLGNGFPIGATIARAEVADSFRGATLSTFGGNPVAMAAANAVLDVISDDHLAANSERIGGHLRRKLKVLQDKHPLVGDVRGMGLLQGVELVKDRLSKEPATAATDALLEETRERGLLIGRGGLFGNVVRLAPALNISEVETDHALTILDHSLSAVEAAL
jgi:4-aminobutyrate aminotransferase-like enzyme